MIRVNFTPRKKSVVYLSGLWLIFVYLVTSIHHVYGGIVYPPDPNSSGFFSGDWRSHLFITAFLPVLFCLIPLFTYLKTNQTIWLRPYAILNGIVVSLIAFWEGGWNHIVKILLFTLGKEKLFSYGPSWLMDFPEVVPPQDIFFEGTGVLTFIFGIINTYYLIQLLKSPLSQNEYNSPAFNQPDKMIKAK